MENTKKLLPTRRQEKLKVFAVLSALKTVPEPLLKDSFALSLMLGYTEAEIIVGSREAIKANDRNPDDYIVGCMKIGVDIEEIIDLPIVEEGKVESHPIKIASPAETFKEQELQVISTVEEYMISNLRTMFNLVGSAEEKKIAEKIIKKFTAYSKKLSTK